MLCWTATVYCRGVCIGDFVRQYCPSAKTLPNADNLNCKYLTENGDALVGKLMERIDGNVQCDLTRLLMAWIIQFCQLFSFYDFKANKPGSFCADVMFISSVDTISISRAIAQAIAKYQLILENVA